MLGCLTCGSAMWRSHVSKWDPHSKLWLCKFNKIPSFPCTPQLPKGRVSTPPFVTLCGCSNYSCRCYLYKPIKHLLMMILSLDQWGKLTYKKPGILTSQPGFVLTSVDSIMYLCCPIPKDSLPASNCAQYPLECTDTPVVIKQSIKMHNYTLFMVCTSLAKLHGIISTS